MLSQKYFVIVMIACAACAASAVPFNFVRDQTICKSVVEYDTNLERIPKTIKMIKCADDPYEMCPASNGKSVPCCGALTLAGGAKFSCTEVEDKVIVQNAKTMEETELTVAIGCSCIKQDPNKATE